MDVLTHDDHRNMACQCLYLDPFICRKGTPQ